MPLHRASLSLLTLGWLAAQAPLVAEGYDFGHAGFGAWTVPVSLDQQAQQDLQPGQGMLVIGVRPGGTASSLGIQPGDVLTSLNNTPISSRQDIREVVLGAQAGDAALADVLTPNGESETLSGTFQSRPPRPAWAGAFGPGQGPGAGAGAGATPPFGGAGNAAMWNPQAIIAQQREELLGEHDALQAIEQLIVRVHADLAAAGGPAGAWLLHYQLHPPATMTVTAGERAAQSTLMTQSALADVAPAWSCSISCCSPAEGVPGAER